MSVTFEKVSADEFARRHGWRRSAVIQRIEAGIYDGVKENGTWYVLRDVPEDVPTCEPEVVVHEPPTLPWPTASFPISWVGSAFWIGFAIMILPLVVGRVDELFWLFGVGMVIATATQLYEGLATGTMRGLYIDDMTYGQNPLWYAALGASYLVHTLIGLFVIVHSIFS